MLSKKACLIALALACSPLSPALAVEVGPPELVADLEPGPESSHPQTFVQVGDLAFFLTGEYYGAGTALWRTDGTTSGTFRVSPESIVVRRVFLPPTGGLFYFIGWSSDEFGDLQTDLWRSDGTVQGTFPITSDLELPRPSSTAHLIPYGLFVPELGLFFFSAGTTESDYELWATDGTTTGTRQVADLNSSGSSYPGEMVAFGGRLFFLRRASVSSDSLEFWTSDGTAAGTFQVKDLYEGEDHITELRVVGDKLLVLAYSPGGQLAVWRSNGTAAGTMLVSEVAPWFVSELTVAGDKLFFGIKASSIYPTELWVTDGTTGGTIRLLAGVAGDVDPYWDDRLVPLGDGVFFSVPGTAGGDEPWFSDGTTVGTRQLADICPGQCSSSPSLVGVAQGKVFFSADDGNAGTEPWVTDGTAAGTRLLGDLCPGSCSSSPWGGVEVEGRMLFAATGPMGQEIWASDGTEAGTSAVTDFAPDLVFNDGFSRILLPGNLLFGADDGSHGVELWSLPVGEQSDPPPPAGEWLSSNRVPGFRFKVRIAGQTSGRQESACIGETLCVSGALAGRSEVFLRVVGPKPNGYLWPTLVKFSTSLVEVWAEQTATGQIRYYRLEASGQGSTLPGIADRTGFLPAGAALAVEDAPVTEEPPPSGDWIVSEGVPGFRVKARLSSGGETRSVRKEPCIGETLCLSGAVAGRPELFVRVVGPKPNGYLWPTLVRFTTSTVEVWIQQTKTGDVRYYRLEGLPRDSSDLSGYFDRQGFLP